MSAQTFFGFACFLIVGALVAFPISDFAGLVGVGVAIWFLTGLLGGSGPTGRRK